MYEHTGWPVLEDTCTETRRSTGVTVARMGQDEINMGASKSSGAADLTYELHFCLAPKYQCHLNHPAAVMDLVWHFNHFSNFEIGRRHSRLAASSSFKLWTYMNRR